MLIHPKYNTCNLQLARVCVNISSVIPDFINNSEHYIQVFRVILPPLKNTPFTNIIKSAVCVVTLRLT